METIVKCAGIAVAGAVLSLTVRKMSGEFAALVGIMAVVLVSMLAMEFLKPVLAFAETLQDTAKLGEGAVGPVLKTLAIGFVTETGKNLCEDAGEKTLGGVLQLAGGLGAFYVMLPLMQSVLELLEGLF